MTREGKKRYYDDPGDNAAFERCIDSMAKMMLKYGAGVLEKIENDMDEMEEAA
jgi:hypothetical protein